MLASDFRKSAWRALSGKWGVMALIALIHALIVGVCAAIPGVGQVGVLLISGPFILGLYMIALNVLRGNAIKVENLFDGFRNFVPAFLLYLINSIFVALWSILLVVPGIVKALSYSMSTFILAENPEMSQAECRKESMRMMQGHKWRLFCLEFSFIGWYLLCGLTFGILSFWVVPYVQVSVAAFYEELKAKSAVGAADTACV